MKINGDRFSLELFYIVVLLRGLCFLLVGVSVNVVSCLEVFVSCHVNQ